MTSKIAVRDAGADQLPDTDRDRVTTALSDARAANTRTAYAKHWRYFTAWCVQTKRRRPRPQRHASRSRRLPSLTGRQPNGPHPSSSPRPPSARPTAPPDSQTRPRPPSSVTPSAASRASTPGHPDAAPRQAKALEYATAIRLLATAEQPRPRGRGHENPATTRARAAGDKAIVSLLFCAGLRRSEAASVTWSDIEDAHSPPGALRVAYGRPKPTPTAPGRTTRLLVDPFAQAIRDLRATLSPIPNLRIASSPCPRPTSPSDSPPSPATPESPASPATPVATGSPPNSSAAVPARPPSKPPVDGNDPTWSAAMPRASASRTAPSQSTSRKRRTVPRDARPAHQSPTRAETSS